MTSQVVLFNGYGVAMASDSALTMSGSRVYDTAEKIVPLPNPHQVAVLMSGNAVLCNYPYTLLLGEWARSLGPTRLGAVIDYANSFLNWLDTSALFAEEQEVQQFGEHLEALCEFVWRRVRELSGEAEKAGTVWTAIDSLSVVKQSLEHYSGFDPLFNVELEWLDDLMKRQNDACVKALEYWFDDVAWSSEADTLMTDTIREYIGRSLWISPARTILAFVGFGAHQLMPEYSEFDVRGAFGSHTLGRSLQARTFEPSELRPYAGVQLLGQSGAIKTFIRGIDEGVYSRTASIVDNAVSKVRRALEDSGVSAQILEESIGQATQGARDEVDNQLGLVEKEVLFDDVIAGLPTGSLVSVANSLIAIQALSLAVNAELNTVGGPIDTATITRDRGFEWVDHKSTRTTP